MIRDNDKKARKSDARTRLTFALRSSANLHLKKKKIILNEYLDSHTFILYNTCKMCGISLIKALDP